MHQQWQPQASLSVIVQLGEDGDTVPLAGEFDAYGALNLSAVIDSLLAIGRRRLLINLDAVTFMDGAAIGALISATERTSRVGGALRVTEHPACLRLLELTGELDRLSLGQSQTAARRQAASAS